MANVQRARYLTREQAAAYLCISIPTLARWASRKTGPRYYRLGRHARYVQQDLDVFIADRASDREESGHSKS
jgi:excisionase family DNA binding protein